MKPVLLGCWLLLLASEAQAHRLDEYLQATRISVATDRIDVSIDLTPGVAVADQVLARIDRDNDGRISEAEGAAYARRVLKDIQIRLDGKVLAARLVGTSVPTLSEIRGGLGVIRIKTTASVRLIGPGQHTFSLFNAHLPAISVYLVNALVPKDSAIKLGNQTRDEPQKAYRLEFEVKPRTP